VESLAKAVAEKNVALKDVRGIKPVFRLTPPAQGFKSTKLAYPEGDLGYRGDKINELIERMI
jgi:large subunit ribosomal protein L30